MQTRALRTFAEIAKSRSFAAAAGRLNMTLSAVSMQMKALEGDLGAALFDRSHRPPRLTPLGRTVLDHAERIVAAEAALRSSCRPGDGLSGLYRVGFVMTASVRLLPGFLTNARRRAPDADFEIVTGLSEGLEARVRDGDLDAAVVTASRERPRGLDYRPLRTEPLVFAAPPEPRSRVPADLAKVMPFLHFMPGSGIGKLVSERMHDVAGPDRERMVLDSVEAIMECVNAGVGFTLLPEPDVRRHAAPSTRIFAAEDPQPARVLALAHAALDGPSAQARLIADLFADPPTPCADAQTETD